MRESIAVQWAEEGMTPIYLALDGRLEGMFAIADPIKPEAKSIVEQLHKQQLEVVMLTGDHAGVAAAVTQQLGIKICHSGLLPEEKIDQVIALQSSGRRGVDGG